jgi:hypothetical protein
MIGRLLATFVMLLLAFAAFWGNALDGGYFSTITGFLLLFLAVVTWFKWATIERIFYAADGDPIIGTTRKVIGGLFRRNDPPLHRSSSSNG